MDVDVEVDVFDACLRRVVPAALVPGAIAQPGVADVGQGQAAPFAARWKVAAGLAGELIGEDLLDALPALALLAPANDDRAELAIAIP